MTVFTDLLGGFATVFSPTNLLLARLVSRSARLSASCPASARR